VSGESEVASLETASCSLDPGAGGRYSWRHVWRNAHIRAKASLSNSSCFPKGNSSIGAEVMIDLTKSKRRLLCVYTPQEVFEERCTLQDRDLLKLSN
jgi:hypothetical protein